MQLKGGKQVTLTAGDTFYEGPTFISLVGLRAILNQQNSLFSWSRRRTPRCSYQSSDYLGLHRSQLTEAFARTWRGWCRKTTSPV